MPQIIFAILIILGLLISGCGNKKNKQSESQQVTKILDDR